MSPSCSVYTADISVRAAPAATETPVKMSTGQPKHAMDCEEFVPVNKDLNRRRRPRLKATNIASA
ncbi:hypothetical protein QJS04_geneDACA023454 [Acorus gramineus]|uniref:Uncharacterized protein n=1 Tax=Acorus gramineus TaxID=55184 RepID=A0AAV9AAY1_ACOGR|nr:hypothetical protein QJS04_geneDACA023454 [Acorus gramineus]